MSLTYRIDEILKHIENQQLRKEYDERIFNILEGNLLPEIEQALQSQLSKNAYENSRPRIAPINVLRRIIDKLSKIYNEPAKRVANSESNQKLVDFWVSEAAIDSNMDDSNEFFNSNKYVAIEPIIDFKTGFPIIRILPPHSFSVISNDKVNPLRPTTFIKYMGNREKSRLLDSGTEIVTVKIYHLYTDDEFLAIDSDGEIVNEDMNLTDGINPYGVIPFVYINKSRFSLLPMPDSDTYRMAVLIPVLLSDLNFAVMFQSHSIFYSVDMEAEGLEFNPHSFWHFKSDEREGATPQVNTLQPNVKIEEVMNLIKNEMALWMESRNIKPGEIGSSSTQTVASGVALMIQNMDITEDLKVQKIFYQEAEKKLWKLIKIIHNFHASEIVESGQFSEDFEVQVQFSESRIIEDRATKITRLQQELQLGVTTKQRIIKELHPNMTEKEIEQLLEEIKNEQTISVSSDKDVDSSDKDADSSDKDANSNDNIDKKKTKKTEK